MITRAEKLFNMRAQVQKAVSEIEHGDTFASCMALSDALNGVLRFLEEESMELEALKKAADDYMARLNEPLYPDEEVKELPRPTVDKETRAALDTLRNEPTKIKRK
jgi:hypothetical protein